MTNPYRYFSDPVFLAAMALFSLNELLLKRISSPAFFHHHFNDLLLIPCALPFLLRFHALLGLRPIEQYPTFAEIAGHLLVWSVLFEFAGPILSSHATGDWLDLVCYGLGGSFSWLVWRNESRLRNATDPA